MNKLEICYTDFWRFYGLYAHFKIDGQEQQMKITSSFNEAKELLSNIGGQTELPERYDIDILQRLVGELKIEADFNDAMDVS